MEYPGQGSLPQYQATVGQPSARRAQQNFDLLHAAGATPPPGNLNLPPTPGEYEISGLMPGTVDVRASAGKNANGVFIHKIRRITLRPGETAVCDFDILTQGDAGLEGNVSIGGVPVNRGLLELEYPSDGPDTVRRALQLDADGAFNFTGLPHGRATLRLARTPLTPNISVDLDLMPGKVTRQDLILEAGSPVNVLVDQLPKNWLCLLFLLEESTVVDQLTPGIYEALEQQAKAWTYFNEGAPKEGWEQIPQGQYNLAAIALPEVSAEGFQQALIQNTPLHVPAPEVLEGPVEVMVSF